MFPQKRCVEEDEALVFASIVSNDQIILPSDRFEERLPIPEICIPILVNPTTNARGTCFDFEYKINPGAYSFLEDIFLEFSFPEQKAQSAGDFFAYTDYIPLKIIDNIKLDLVSSTTQLEIYNISSTIWLQHLLDKYDNFDNLKKILGANNIVKTAFNPDDVLAPATKYLIPIPYPLTNLKLDQLIDPYILKIRINIKRVESCCIRNTTFAPSSQITLKSIFNFISTVKCSQPYKKQKGEGMYTVPPVAVAFEQKTERRMNDKNKELFLPPHTNIQKFAIYVYNPYMSNDKFENIFYGYNTKIAICNFLNTFVFPSSDPNISMYQLKSCTWTKTEPAGMSVRKIDEKTLRLKTNLINVLLTFNAPISDLDEDIYVDFKSLVELNNNITDLTYFSNLNFQILDEADVVVQDTNGSRKSIVGGLFVTNIKKQAIIGFSDYSCFTLTDELKLKLNISRPVLKTTNEYAKKNFCIIQDPLYCFADLDRTIKYNLYDVETSFEDHQYYPMDNSLINIINFKNIVSRRAFNTEERNQAPAFKFNILGTPNIVLAGSKDYSLRFLIGLQSIDGSLINNFLTETYIKNILTRGVVFELPMKVISWVLEIFCIQDADVVRLETNNIEYKNNLKKIYSQ